MIEIFDPPILLNRERLPELPTTITTPGEASVVLHMLPTCGIRGAAWSVVREHRPT